MKLVIDTNKIMAAMIKDSLSRRIISTPMFQFITPDHTLQNSPNTKRQFGKKQNSLIKNSIFYSALSLNTS